MVRWLVAERRKRSLRFHTHTRSGRADGWVVKRTWENLSAGSRDAYVGATYQQRAAIWLRHLLMKRLYNSAWYAVVNPKQGVNGVREPDADLSWAKFEAAIRGRVGEVLA